MSLNDLPDSILKKLSINDLPREMVVLILKNVSMRDLVIMSGDKKIFMHVQSDRGLRNNLLFATQTMDFISPEGLKKLKSELEKKNTVKIDLIRFCDDGHVIDINWTDLNLMSQQNEIRRLKNIQKKNKDIIKKIDKLTDKLNSQRIINIPLKAFDIYFHKIVVPFIKTIDKDQDVSTLKDELLRKRVVGMQSISFNALLALLSTTYPEIDTQFRSMVKDQAIDC